MTARADQREPRSWPASVPIVHSFGVPLIAATAILAASPARAEIGAAASVFSIERVRGYSLSEGHPVASLNLSYDSSTGIYAGASGKIVANSSDGVRPLGFQLNAGYAKQISSAVTAEFGILHSHYFRQPGSEPVSSYTEIYAGVSGKLLSSRIYYSPHYFLGGGPTLYSELNATSGGYSGFRLEGHAGLLLSLPRGNSGASSAAQFDWRLGVSRSFGRLGLHAAWSGRRRRNAAYYYDYGGRNAFVFGASYSL